MSVIDDYLQTIPADQRAALEKIRHLVKQRVPESNEVISYGIPTFDYKGRHLLHFAAFTNHLSIFPTSKPTAVLSDKLKDYKVSKGTIQFTVEKPLPDKLVQEIIDIRLKDING